MRCRYHVGVEMLATERSIPFEKEEMELTRLELACPVVGCFCVAHEYDAERVNRRKCLICGGEVKHSSLTDNRCGKCRHEESKRRYQVVKKLKAAHA